MPENDTSHPSPPNEVTAFFLKRDLDSLRLQEKSDELAEEARRFLEERLAERRRKEQLQASLLTLGIAAGMVFWWVWKGKKA